MLRLKVLINGMTDFDFVNFPFLMVMFLVRHPMVFIFVNLLVLLECPVMSMTRNIILTAKLLRQVYRYHKLRKAFSKFYRQHFDLVSKFITFLTMNYLFFSVKKKPVIAHQCIISFLQIDCFHALTGMQIINHMTLAPALAMTSSVGTTFRSTIFRSMLSSARYALSECRTISSRSTGMKSTIY